MSASGKILVANIGSTSFKFRLFDMPAERLLASGGADRIGQSDSAWSFRCGDEPARKGGATFPDYAAAVGHFASLLASAGVLKDFASDLAAVGFKPVMAKGISGTRHMDATVLAAMEALYTLFPAHNPPYVKAVRSFNALFPKLPCIGTFETAFYEHLPRAATRFPVPLDWERDHGIRRHGFHGASHRFVSERAAQLCGKPGQARVISCHLGGSSSVCAVRDGRAIDSSWGMTPQSGLAQNNRVGDFDVFAALHLMRNCGLSLDEVERRLSSDAGLKGMSGLPSGDMRDVRAAALAGNDDARTALEVFVGQVRKYVGQFLVELNGCDVLSFTAGIGENNPWLRAAICSGMDFCGLELDAAANEACMGTESIISTPRSSIQVRVIPTNEEIIIAREAWALLNA